MHLFPFQTLGHLEKAVVLELTLKHVKALTGLIEQQQQKILALQNGLQIGKQRPELCFHSIFVFINTTCYLFINAILDLVTNNLIFHTC